MFIFSGTYVRYVYIASNAKHRLTIYVEKLVKHILKGFIHVIFIKFEVIVTI